MLREEGDDLPSGTLLLLGFDVVCGGGRFGLGSWGIVVGRITNSRGWSYLIAGVGRVGRLTPHVMTSELRRRNFVVMC